MNSGNLNLLGEGRACYSGVKGISWKGGSGGVLSAGVACKQLQQNDPHGEDIGRSGVLTQPGRQGQRVLAARAAVMHRALLGQSTVWLCCCLDSFGEARTSYAESKGESKDVRPVQSGRFGIPRVLNQPDGRAPGVKSSGC